MIKIRNIPSAERQSTNDEISLNFKVPIFVKRFTAGAALVLLANTTAGVQAQTEIGSGISIGGSYAFGFAAGKTELPGTTNEISSSAKQRLTLHLTADLGDLWGGDSGTFFIQYQNHNGRSAHEHTLDIQQFDGLDDPEYNRIHMLWYQQVFADGKFRFKVGKVDPKSEFFAPKNAGNHLGFSTGRSPTIIAQGPPSLSVNLFFKPSNTFELAFGVYDAAFNQGRDESNFKFHDPFDIQDIALFAEARFHWDGNNGALPGDFKVGAWRLDGEKTRFDGSTASGANGMYLTYDQALNSNGLGLYAQYGFTNGDTSALTTHIGVGLQWVGAFDGRGNDIFGAGISYVKFSDAPGSPFIQSAETAYEIFYKAPLSKWFTIQADIQEITNPGGLGAGDVLVGVLRGTISF